MTNTEIVFDQPLAFTLSAQDARGRVVRLGPVLDVILSAHQYPPVAERVLAEALVLTALLGSTLKQADSQLTMQAQTEGGPITLLVCDYMAGQLRGHLSFDAEALAMAGEDPSLFALFGKGFLGITFDHGAVAGGEGQRYQGIVPLEGHTLADAVQAYFRQSEQLPTFLRTAIRHDAGAGCIAAGVMIQHLPEGEEGAERLHVRAEGALDANAAWEHVSILAETLTADEMTDPALPLDALVWRLFHEETEIRVLPGAKLSRGCRCDPAYIATVLARFPDDERAEMAEADGLVRVDCAFCSRQFAIDPGVVPVSH
jgi:molecular chaperone Hsp33